MPRVSQKTINTIKSEQKTVKEIAQKKLNLCCRNLSEVPEFVKDMPVKEIYISNNKIRKLPSWLFNKNEIEFLDLSNNRIESLPYFLGNLHNLNELVLNNNNLSALPESISGLYSLEYLWLENNRVKDLPDSLFKLRRLRFAYLKGNDLSVDSSFKARARWGDTHY